MRTAPIGTGSPTLAAPSSVTSWDRDSSKCERDACHLRAASRTNWSARRARTTVLYAAVHIVARHDWRHDAVPPSSAQLQPSQTSKVGDGEHRLSGCATGVKRVKRVAGVAEDSGRDRPWDRAIARDGSVAVQRLKCECWAIVVLPRLSSPGSIAMPDEPWMTSATRRRCCQLWATPRPDPQRRSGVRS
jgi:hypothetical protein